MSELVNEKVVHVCSQLITGVITLKKKAASLFRNLKHVEIKRPLTERPQSASLLFLLPLSVYVWHYVTDGSRGRHTNIHTHLHVRTHAVFAVSYAPLLPTESRFIDIPPPFVSLNASSWSHPSSHIYPSSSSLSACVSTHMDVFHLLPHTYTHTHTHWVARDRYPNRLKT